MIRFDRGALEFALRQLLTKLHAQDEPTGLRIIGGAALSLRYFEREATVDIDAHPIGDSALVLAAGRTVAEENGWPIDWLNDLASGFIPEYGRVTPNWETLYERDGVSIQVPSAQAMLAMKLRANRPGRDDVDIAKLMAICDVTAVEQAEELYEAFYSTEVLPDRAVAMIERILALGLPPRPEQPSAPRLDPRSDQPRTM
ncbi:hypothetical protein [Agromyces aerolatus]|uniref:hypothetical protein n=1 Tax=Agromyces sp. LY-1074 TaxID=3074080 RepID=UPI0028569BD5|nr:MULTISPECIES: hypothetical protein [unclassified Agromyces]MDR5699584.1 hypothetical protein [Agromyces sp. LY-1074]MDR5705880.1 hypothetical protein [Agromyces sp. LY-1358]